MSIIPSMKTRFCPSPTGLMHLGNLRTALFNRLVIGKTDSHDIKPSFLLRIEDTDLARSEQVYAEQLMRDLKWLGLLWDEGPYVGGEHAPYYQAQRKSIYQAFYDTLLKEHKAYYCFCSEKTLSITRKLQIAAGQPPRYPGTCRHLSLKEVEDKLAQNTNYTLRFRIPENEEIRFVDLIQGQKVFSSDDLGDFIIKKEDGTPTFMFCNAIDDAVMNVTHALRGEDHLTNTPRQILILKALNLPQPQYGHMSLIVGKDGKPLSKRNGSMSIQELRDKGYWPLAILNYLSRLGHHYTNDKWMNWETLCHEFALPQIGRSPACFDLHQLHHWQKEALQQLTNETLWQWMATKVKAWVPEDKTLHFVDVIRDNILFPEEALTWAQILFDSIHFKEKELTILKTAGTSFFNQAVEQATHFKEPSELIANIKTQTGCKGKLLFMPIRVALTGEQSGPELPKVINLLGQEEVVRRFKRAGELC